MHGIQMYNDFNINSISRRISTSVRRRCNTLSYTLYYTLITVLCFLYTCSGFMFGGEILVHSTFSLGNILKETNHHHIVSSKMRNAGFIRFITRVIKWKTPDIPIQTTVCVCLNFCPSGPNNLYSAHLT